MQFFTICSGNFMAQAYALYESIVTHHPDSSFAVALCDQLGDFDPHMFPFEILTLDNFEIEALPEMIEQYNITELNTAIKPFVFNFFHEAAPDQPVIYLDPDIKILSQLEELFAVLDDGADCVLTPHMLEPSEWAEMNEGRLLQYGIYNLGFLALRSTPEVRRICQWWARRLQRECVIDMSKGLFVDQKWADLFPSFIPRTHILRHPGYNVAYWNLSQRKITRQDNMWKVNGQPLRFFHFSGSVVSEPSEFTRHNSFFIKGGLRDLDILFDEYCADVRRNGLSNYQIEFPFSFEWGGARGKNEHTAADLSSVKRLASQSGASIMSEENFPHLPVLRASSIEEYNQKMAAINQVVKNRRIVEDKLVPEKDPFKVPGYCVVCGAQQSFMVSSMYSPGNYPDGRAIPNWREHMNCKCGFTNRLRATLHVMQQEIAPSRTDQIYLTEQVTPLFQWFSDRYESVHGSEYLGPQHKGGEIINGIRHEDIQDLSFPDESFDRIISLEVLEHVPFPERAFAELRRCLRDGGSVLLTAPFAANDAYDVIRAKLTDTGEIEHLMEPEFHGNPVDPEGGALCFRYFGWSMIDQLKEAGFKEAEVLFYWSQRYGYLGNTNAIILARA